MEITKEFYQQLCENYKATRTMMTDEDCEEMRCKLNEMRELLAFKSCVSEWKADKTINVSDFLIVCETVAIDIPNAVATWINSDLLEVGRTSYSSIGKLSTRKENTLLKLCFELTSKI